MGQILSSSPNRFYILSFDLKDVDKVTKINEEDSIPYYIGPVLEFRGCMHDDPKTMRTFSFTPKDIHQNFSSLTCFTHKNETFEIQRNPTPTPEITEQLVAIANEMRDFYINGKFSFGHVKKLKEAQQERQEEAQQ